MLGFSGEVWGVQHLPLPPAQGSGLRVLCGPVPGQGGALHQPHQLPGPQGERPWVPQHDALHRAGRHQGHCADGWGVRQRQSGKKCISNCFRSLSRFMQHFASWGLSWVQKYRPPVQRSIHFITEITKGLKSFVLKLKFCRTHLKPGV